MLKREDGFFIVDKVSFTSEADFNRNAKTWEEVNLETAFEVKYQVGLGYICIDCDGHGSSEAFQKKLKQWKIECEYQYQTKAPEDAKSGKEHRHFWFKVDEKGQKMIDIFKLNSSSGKLGDHIDTRSCRFEEIEDEKGKIESRVISGGVYLKSKGKVNSTRPTPEKLVKTLKTLKNPIPGYLLLSKNVGIVPKSGKGGDKKVFQIASNFKKLGLEGEDFNDYVKASARIFKDRHDVQATKHKGKSAKENEGLKHLKNDTEIRTQSEGVAGMYEKDLWVKNKENNLGVNLHKVVRGTQFREYRDAGFRVLGVEGKDIEDQVLTNNLEIFRGIVFLNGYVSEETGNFVETADIPFSTTQIPRSYKEVEINRNLGEFLNFELCGSDETGYKYAKLMMALSTCLSNRNFAFFPIIYGKGGIGKGTIMELLTQTIGGNNYAKMNSDNVFGKGDHKFALSGSKGTTLVGFDEIPVAFTASASETIKLIADDTYGFAIEQKGVDPDKTINTATGIATTNNLPYITNYVRDDALQSRIVVFHFDNERNEEYSDLLRDIKRNPEAYIEGFLTTLVKAYRMLLNNPFFNTKVRGEPFRTGDEEALFEHNQQDDVFEGYYSYVRTNERFRTNSAFDIYELQTSYLGYTNNNKKSRKAFEVRLEELNFTRININGKELGKLPKEEN